MLKLPNASSQKKPQVIVCVFIFFLAGYTTITRYELFERNLTTIVSKYANQRAKNVTKFSIRKLYSNETCGDEPFVYEHTSVHGFFKTDKQKGIKFNCSLLKYLEMLKLTEEYKLPVFVPSNYPSDMVFLGAVNDRFFPTMRLAFDTVRKQFGCQNKFILYDLTGLKEKHGDEIQKWCNVELRQFDFTKFPKHVKNLRVFSWKILMLAQVFNEATNIIYLDSSIFFSGNNYKPFFGQMSKLQLTPALLPGCTFHSIGFATNPRMYDYLPMDLNISNKTMMLEANFILIHRSDPTRELLKWATLCALTLDCIDPPGSIVYCNTTRINETAVCNRQDQSVLTILALNQERQLRKEGYPTKFFDDPDHPITANERMHQVRRREHINMSLVELYKGV